MDFLRTLSLAASGLRTQAGRMRIIAENIANADSTPAKPGADPYRRKIVSFTSSFDKELDGRVVALGKVARDQSPFETRHMPGHPAADANGMVQLPNVNSLIEQMDMREAQRSYEANLNVIGATRRMIGRTIDILRG